MSKSLLSQRRSQAVIDVEIAQTKELRDQAVREGFALGKAQVDPEALRRRELQAHQSGFSHGAFACIRFLLEQKHLEGEEKNRLLAEFYAWIERAWQDEPLGYS